jgi:tetratricopeptide (TPR) repeat protein
MWPFRRSGNPSRRGTLRRAQALATRGRADEAASLLSEYCDGNPGDFAALVNLGAVYYSLGKYTPAIERFEQAAALKPDSATVWMNLGAARNALGHIDRAIEALMKALEADPQHRDVHYNLAVAQQKKGRPLAALAELELELALHPDHKQARALAAQLKGALLPQEPAGR